jgi:AcrR family transcriptional regulator
VETPDSTRERILDAAERLFAERGLDGVSLREINAAAGARNASAVQYHFGNRDGLVWAVVSRRMAAVELRRLGMLDELTRSGRLKASGLRPVIEALVLPLAHELSTATGRRYLRIVGQLVDRPTEFGVTISSLRLNASLRRCADLLDREMGELPPDVAAQRKKHLLGFALRAMAGQAARGRRKDDGLFLANLVDMLTAAGGAPASKATRSVAAGRTPA